MILILISIVTSFFISIYLRSNREIKKKIYNIYSVEGKWYHLKYFVMFSILKLRRSSSKKNEDTAGMGYAVAKVEDIEKLQPLSKEEKAFDAVFYHGVNNDGYYFVGGIERRQNSKVNGLVYLLIPEIGLLHSEHMPKTELNADLQEKNSFAGGGISFTPITPMQHWKISYNGKMWTGDETNKKWYNVKLIGDFKSNMPHFVVDTDADQRALARAIAKETWSKQFFETLKSAHQTHYEQMGTINASLTINDKEYVLDLMGFRDHSFGAKRDWTLLHRYIFHMFYLENDVRISCGVVSQPCTMSHFEIGYVLYPNKSIHPIQSCDLKLYQHGEDGNPPKTIAFTFQANGENYDCKVEYLDCDSVHYKGSDVEARLIERFFTCEVNGMKGRGVSEWHYNNVGTYTNHSEEST